MSRNSVCLLLISLLVTPMAAAQDGVPPLIGAPYLGWTAIGPSGALIEDWGQAEVSLSVEGREAQAGPPVLSVAPFPEAVTSRVAGSVTMETRAYRAPLWPAGVDVLEVELTNIGQAAQQAELILRTSDDVSWGETEAVAGGRIVARLPDGLTAVRRSREWGCTTAAARLPGWGRPARDCDPAFRHIRAGMGGIPIIYMLKVRPGSEHQVVLGLCESHWSTPGQRPVEYYVEGAQREVVDCIAAFGHNQPGALYFSARDRNGDGLLQIVAAPGPDAPDRNPILNVIWLFSPDDYIDTDDVLTGSQNSAAECYVDCGGPGDQDLYEGGEVRFPLVIGPGEARAVRFLFAPAGSSLPSAAGYPLPAAELRAAAADVWGGWLRSLPRSIRGNKEVLASLSWIAMSGAQSDDFYVALPGESGVASYSLVCHAATAWALDEAGLHEHAERLLRILIDKPAPDPLGGLVQSEDGSWPDPADCPEAQGLALFALARHAVLTRDRDWAVRAWPAMKLAAGRMLSLASSGPWETAAIREVAAAAKVAGVSAEDIAARAAELPDGPRPRASQIPGEGRTLEAARTVLREVNAA